MLCFAFQFTQYQQVHLIKLSGHSMSPVRFKFHKEVFPTSLKGILSISVKIMIAIMIGS